MWILLMIIFSQPYQISDIEILGTYVNKKACTDTVDRALSVGVPVKTSFGCILVERDGNFIES
tara:strand:- start:833 stop:1021 length:189 start_codon:yes stop_codon:yes gene_type:complete